MAEAVLSGLVETIGPYERYAVVGFSFGGLIAGHLAAMAQERVSSLTIVGTTGWPGIPVNAIPIARSRGLARVDARHAHRTNLARLMIADPTGIDECALWIQERHAESVRIDSRAYYRRAPLSDALRVLSMPVNGIWGELDAIAYPHVGAREAAMRELVSDLRFRVIAEAGHWVGYERPDAFNATLVSLLA